MPKYRSKLDSSLEANPTKYRSDIVSPLDANPTKYRSYAHSPLDFGGPNHMIIGHTGYDLTYLDLVDFSTEDFLTIPSYYGFQGAAVDIVRRIAVFVSVQFSTLIFIDIDTFTELGTLTIPASSGGSLLGGGIIIDSVNGYAYINGYYSVTSATYIIKINISTMLIDSTLSYTNAVDHYYPENHPTGTFWLDSTYLYFTAVYQGISQRMGIGKIDLATFAKAGYSTGANIYASESCGRNIWDGSGNLYQGFEQGGTANQYLNKYIGGPTYIGSILLGTDEGGESGTLAITSNGKYIIYPTRRTGTNPTILARINTDTFTEDGTITLSANDHGLYNYAAYDEGRDVFYVSIGLVSGIWKVTPDPFATVTKKLLTVGGAQCFVVY